MSEQEKGMKELAGEFAKARDDVKAIGEEIQGRMEKGEKNFEALKEQADEALVTLNGLKAQVQELEQKAARDGTTEPVAAKSIGQRLVESEQFIKLVGEKAGRGRASLELKAGELGSATTDADGSAGDLVQTARLPGILQMPQRRLVVRDLLTGGTMGGNALEYVQETGFTNNADMVAEFGKKPQSSLKFDVKSTSAKVIAHYMKASRQILDDAPQLRSIIDGRLRHGLKLKEEDQLLNGDGQGQNLHGLLPQANTFANPTSLAGYTIIDQLRLAALQVALAEFDATGFVINPKDWAEIELMKDSLGRYIIGNPQGTIAASLWNLPVVATQAMAPKNFITGAFDMGAQIFDRWQDRVEVATENEDDFIKNMVTVLAEERLAFAVYRPEAFVKGTLAATSQGSGGGNVVTVPGSGAIGG